jgi:preprotein translocase subunit SecB
MPDEEQPQLEMHETHVKGVEFVEPSQVPELYANNVVPAITNIDVTLHFGTLMEIKDGRAKVARRISIILTPEVAKMLNIQLSLGLANYEKNVRQIPTLGKVLESPKS